MIHWFNGKEKTRPERSGRAGVASAAGRLLVPVLLELLELLELVAGNQPLRSASLTKLRAVGIVRELIPENHPAIKALIHQLKSTRRK
jgi:hypothetical protein